MFCAVSATITTIALAIALGVRNSTPRSQSQTGPTVSPDSNTCLTQGCVQLAAQVTAAMNQSVDPCEDFYQFSCGNWGQRNLIPPGKSNHYPCINYLTHNGHKYCQLEALQVSVKPRLSAVVCASGHNSM